MNARILTGVLNVKYNIENGFNTGPGDMGDITLTDESLSMN